MLAFRALLQIINFKINIKMTITINETVIYYWIFSIVFGTIYNYIQIKIGWRQLKKSAESHQMVIIFLDSIKKLAATQFLLRQIFNIKGYFIGYLIFCIISPILLPFSLSTLFKKMIGYKSNLQKKAEAEGAKMEQAEKDAKEWMKNEGVQEYIENPINPIINDCDDAVR
jgi:hypothetical protein